MKTASGLAESQKHLRLPFAVAIFCATFNFGLAVLNAAAGSVNTTVVTLVQVLATSMVVACLFKYRARVSLGYLYVVVGVASSWVMVSAYKGSYDLSGLYGAVSVPIFVIFGTLFRPFPTRWLMRFVLVVLAVAIFETVLPNLYVAIANPLSYYRATRAWVAAQQAADSDGLYVGAIRAGGSVFSFFNHHRAGSIFLEPLSLGYFASISFILLSVLYRGQGRRLLSAFCACVLMSLLADTRISTLIIVLTMALMVVRRPPAIATWTMIAVVYVGGYLAYQWIGKWGGDLAYRLSLSYESFANASFGQWLAGDLRVLTLGDSGLVSMLGNYGLIGFALFMVAALNLLDIAWLRSSHAPVAIALYFCVASLFGSAMLSIKTSIFLGIAVGALGKLPSRSISHA